MLGLSTFLRGYWPANRALQQFDLSRGVSEYLEILFLAGKRLTSREILAAVTVNFPTLLMHE